VHQPSVMQGRAVSSSFPLKLSQAVLGWSCIYYLGTPQHTGIVQGAKFGSDINDGRTLQRTVSNKSLDLLLFVDSGSKVHI